MIRNRVAKFWHTPPEPQERPQALRGGITALTCWNARTATYGASVVGFLGKAAWWLVGFLVTLGAKTAMGW